MRKQLVVCGDSQAEAVALVLQSVDFIKAAYDVRYVPAAPSNSGGQTILQAAAIVCEQTSANQAALRKDISPNQRRLRFPALEFNLLWPLTCANPFDRAEPPKYPFGRFPYGDSFILNCIRRNMPAKKIMESYSVGAWPPTWPNLNKLFQTESARLSSQDTRNDVKIGAFVLKYFRRKRLFWAAKNPSNLLFAELVFRLLHACFGAEQPVDRIDLEKLLAGLGTRDLLATISVPIHPLVAQHFDLEWYDADAAYPYFDGEYTYVQYFSEMIDHSVAVRA